jgi:hypothetical protein
MVLTKHVPYRYERVLVDAFCEILDSRDTPWGKLSHVREFEYGRGRTDVVAVDERDRVIAFEFKLKKWTKAMHQAYRNTCFAHSSYIVLPDDVAQIAQVNTAAFKRRSVGICSIKGNAIVVHLPANRNEPIQPWLTRAAIHRAGSDCGCIGQEYS